MGDSEDLSPVKPKKSRTLRGKAGRAKLKEIQPETKASVTEKGDSGYYVDVTSLYDQLKSGAITQTSLSLVVDDDDDEVSVHKVTESSPQDTSFNCGLKDGILVLSDDECDTEITTSDSHVQDSPVVPRVPAASDLQSPSPPPPPTVPTGKAKRATRKSKQKKKILTAVQALDMDLRMAAQQMRTDSVKEPDVVLLDTNNEDDKLTVRLQMRAKIHRYHLGLDEPFSVIASQIASEENVGETHVMLVHNDITLKPSTDTPRSVHYSTADIIDCHILDTLEESLTESGPRPDDPDCIEVVLQSRSTKRRELVVINKYRPLSQMMKSYSEVTGKPLETLKFWFDGETVGASETADSLDIDDLDIIDVQEIEVTVIT